MGGTRRLTLREAAGFLGISVEAVRKRTMRGSLPSDLGPDGRRYVYLDDGRDDPHPQAGDEGLAPTVAILREEVGHLRELLSQANERDRENRRIIAALTQRIPELPPAPPAPPESREEPPGEPAAPPGGVSDRGARQDGSHERVPWWRRVFR